mmetsp:Transcript_40971/g.92408  ORF Transcript_40971/g.92408 Transcript_40971/m.92408 type:complete len:235 (+) Transcript_40971:1627-2331(+)
MMHILCTIRIDQGIRSNDLSGDSHWETELNINGSLRIGQGIGHRLLRATGANLQGLNGWIAFNRRERIWGVVEEVHLHRRTIRLVIRDRLGRATVGSHNPGRKAVIQNRSVLRIARRQSAVQFERDLAVGFRPRDQLPVLDGVCRWHRLDSRVAVHSLPFTSIFMNVHHVTSHHPSQLSNAEPHPPRGGHLDCQVQPLTCHFPINFHLRHDLLLAVVRTPGSQRAHSDYTAERS